jgi:glycosyltransferase involved in cell wall biosynthesis
MKKNLVTIIICAYNGEKYLESSINSALTQTYNNIQLIIINDKSSDGTDRIIKSFIGDERILYISNGINLGLSRSRNIGLLASGGDWITFLDQDDLFEIDRIDKFVNLALEYKSIDFFFSSVGYINENNIRTGCFTERFSFLEKSKIIRNPNIYLAVYGNYIATVSSFISSKLVKMVGTFDPRFNYACDFDYYLRCGAVCNFYYINAELSSWRVHDSQQTKLSTSRYKETRMVIFKNFKYNFLLKPYFILRVLSLYLLPFLK